MTIETLLELRLDMMERAHEALEVLERTWNKQGRPTKAPELIRVLKMTMDRCVRSGITYPRIFLRRKGELGRGDFHPRQEIHSVVDPTALKFVVPSHPKIPREFIDQALQKYKMRAGSTSKEGS